MLELKDGMNWHTFEASFKTEEWKRRGEGESVLEWLKRVSIKHSGWLDKAKWRTSNKYWIGNSCEISLTILSFLGQNKMEKETLEDLIGFELDLSGSYDWRLSEIKKLELYLNKKLL
jgi:hypothetical protein